MTTTTATATTLQDRVAIMVNRLALEIEDGAVTHVGAYTPLVAAAALLAKATHAPKSVIFPVSLNGVVSDDVFPITLSMWEPMSMCNGLAYRVIELFNHVEGDRNFDLEPIAPAQIDEYGNVNNSVIGDYRRPKLRFPGPAGIDNLTLCPRTPVILYSTRHNKRTFVPKVDFITGAGFLSGPGAREKAGIPAGGPRLVVTDLGVMDFDARSKRMRLLTVHEGVTVEQVRENTGFDLLAAPNVGTTPPPTAETVRLLRERIDPLNLCELEFLAADERRKRILETLDREYERYCS